MNTELLKMFEVISDYSNSSKTQSQRNKERKVYTELLRDLLIAAKKDGYSLQNSSIECKYLPMGGLSRADIFNFEFY